MLEEINKGHFLLWFDGKTFFIKHVQCTSCTTITGARIICSKQPGILKQSILSSEVINKVS